MWEEFCNIYSPVKEEEGERWELEEKRRDFINEFYYEKLNFCGCGRPWDILYTIKCVLNTVKRKYDKDYNCNYELYEKELKENLNLKENDLRITDGVIQIVFNVLNNCDVLEHGGGIRGSWLTKYGEKLLEDLNALSDEELWKILD